MTITANQFFAFAGSLAGTTVLTTDSKPFTVVVRGNNMYVTPQSTGLEQPPLTPNSVQKALAIYNRTFSLKPTDYQEETAHSSYFVGLLIAYLAQAQQQNQRPPSNNSNGQQ